MTEASPCMLNVSMCFYEPQGIGKCCICVFTHSARLSCNVIIDDVINHDVNVQEAMGKICGYVLASFPGLPTSPKFWCCKQ